MSADEAISRHYVILSEEIYSPFIKREYPSGGIYSSFLFFVLQLSHNTK